MSTFSMTGVVSFAPKWVDGSATVTDSTQVQMSLAHGTGSGQANAYWSDAVSVATNASQTIDLTTLAVAAFGATGTIVLESAKAIGIVNESVNVAVTVEPGASNGWSQIGTTTLGKSGAMTIYSPAGMAVGSTSKTIKLTNTHTATTLSGNTTSGSAAATGLSSTTGLSAGMLVSGTGIPAGAKIASVTSGTAVALSANATATGTGVSLTFQWPAATVKVFVAGVLD